MKQFELTFGQDKYTAHATDIDGVIHIDLMHSGQTEVIAHTEVDLNEGVAFTTVDEEEYPINIDRLNQLVGDLGVAHSISYTTLSNYLHHQRTWGSN